MPRHLHSGFVIPVGMIHGEQGVHNEEHGREKGHDMCIFEGENPLACNLVSPRSRNHDNRQGYDTHERQLFVDFLEHVHVYWALLDTIVYQTRHKLEQDDQREQADEAH